MKIAYGHNRSDTDFAHAEPDKLFLDHTGTDRQARRDMIECDLDQDDTLILLAPGDLGAGGELPALRKRLADMGVTIQVDPGPTPPKGKPGPRPSLTMTDEQRNRVLPYWQSPGLYTPGYVFNLVRDLTDYSGTDTQLRQALNYQLGPRGAAQK